MNLPKLRAQLIRHEGCVLKAYKCPAGKTTVGVGRNLDDKGLSLDEAEYLLENDIREIAVRLAQAVPCFGSLDDVRQRVLADMTFNLGITGLLKFQQMLKACEARDFARAAEEMLDSRWASQVGQRSKTLARMMREGQD